MNHRWMAWTRPTTTLFCLSLTSMGWLSSAAAYVGDNHAWTLTCNASGYELTSKYPVSRFIEGGVNSTSTEEIEKLYLGRSCDAEHKVLGKGKWCWANGGFRAEFSSHSIGCPRQALSCPNEADAISGCEC